MNRTARKAYLALGTNLGDRLANLKRAPELLLAEPGLELEACSNIYETEPVGGPDQGPFLNVCLSVKTDLSPVTLLLRMLAVEEKMKRVREKRWGPRIIDLDLLIYEATIMNTPLLQLPHPRLAERDFVLIPLANIAPGLLVPGGNRTVQEILDRRKENPGVKFYRPSDWCGTR